MRTGPSLRQRPPAHRERLFVPHAQDFQCALGLLAPHPAAFRLTIALVVQLAVVWRPSEHVARCGTELLELRAEVIEQVLLTREAVEDALLRFAIRAAEV